MLLSTHKLAVIRNLYSYPAPKIQQSLLQQSKVQELKLLQWQCTVEVKLVLYLLSTTNKDNKIMKTRFQFVLRKLIKNLIHYNMQILIT